MKLVGKTERQRGKGKYEYIPEYNSAGFSNTGDVKHSTPKERRGLYLYMRLYRGQDLKSAGSAFVPGVCNFRKYSQTQAIYCHSFKKTFIKKKSVHEYIIIFLFFFSVYTSGGKRSTLGFWSEKQITFAWCQASAAALVRSPLIWDVKLRILVVGHRRFGTTYL